MSVSVTFGLRCDVRETLESGVDGAETPVIVHNGLNKTGTLNATSTPPATKSVQDNVALVAGAKTLDLRALTGVNGAAIDGNGLKVQLIAFTNKGLAAMTFAKGASNGYSLWTNWTLTLPPGGAVEFFLNDGPEDIDATHKTIDVTGTGTQDFDFRVVMG